MQGSTIWRLSMTIFRCRHRAIGAFNRLCKEASSCAIFIENRVSHLLERALSSTRYSGFKHLTNCWDYCVIWIDLWNCVGGICASVGLKSSSDAIWACSPCPWDFSKFYRNTKPDIQSLNKSLIKNHHTSVPLFDLLDVLRRNTGLVRSGHKNSISRHASLESCRGTLAPFLGAVVKDQRDLFDGKLLRLWGKK